MMGVLKKLVLAILAIGTAVEAGAQGIPLAEDSQPRVLIAVAADPTAAEANAAALLTEYLQKVTGAEFKQIPEKDVPQDAPAVYVGQTRYAAVKGQVYARLDGEEWVIRTDGKNLILCGGRPRGTIYAVFEFLERQAGVHWFDYVTEDIPHKPSLAVSNLDVCAKPAFWYRASCTGIVPVRPTASKARYEVANRFNDSGEARWGGAELIGSGGFCHNLHTYLPPAQYFAQHPEYYSLHSGRREGRAHQSQICFSNLDVRSIFKKTLHEYIASDLKAVGPEGVRLTPPKFYNITQEDVHPAKFCECDKCMKIWDREGGTQGGNSGLLLDFINEIADSIKTDHPGLLLETFAYTVALDPPKTVRPRDNVMMQFADYYGDTWRPMTHPHNARSLAYLQAWSQIAKTLSAWDYGITYGVGFNVPASNVRVLAEDIATWHKHHTRRFFLECEAANHTSFHSLKNWLVAKLLVDPYQDAEPLIATFMAGYYGPAAPFMDGFLRFTEQAIRDSDEWIAREEGSRSWRLPYNLRLLSAGYFSQCYAFLDKAEAACGGDERYLRAVRRERIVVDRAALMRRDWLEREAGQGAKPPLDWDRIISRYEKDRLADMEMWAAAGYRAGSLLTATRPAVEKEINGYRLYGKPFPLPAEFQKAAPGDVIDFAWPQLAHNRLDGIADDPAAAGGKAYNPGGFAWGAAQPKTDPSATVCVAVTSLQPSVPPGKSHCALVIAKKDLPDDEAFHWYRVGTVKTLEPGMAMTVSGIGGAMYMFFDCLCRPEAKDKSYNVFVSLKTRGLNPEKKTDVKPMVAADRILFVK